MKNKFTRSKTAAFDMSVLGGAPSVEPTDTKEQMVEKLLQTPGAKKQISTAKGGTYQDILKLMGKLQPSGIGLGIGAGTGAFGGGYAGYKAHQAWGKGGAIPQSAYIIAGGLLGAVGGGFAGNWIQALIRKLKVKKQISNVFKPVV